CPWRFEFVWEENARGEIPGYSFGAVPDSSGAIPRSVPRRYPPAHGRSPEASRSGARSPLASRRCDPLDPSPQPDRGSRRSSSCRSAVEIVAARLEPRLAIAHPDWRVARLAGRLLAHPPGHAPKLLLGARHPVARGGCGGREGPNRKKERAPPPFVR